MRSGGRRVHDAAQSDGRRSYLNSPTGAIVALDGSSRTIFVADNHV
jgi:hypothetical protein